MPLKMEASWEDQLKEEFKKEYYQDLMDFLEKEYTTHKCFPPKDDIFSAFAHTGFNDVKVVIIGQDPYHGEGQANGLSFSIADGFKFPPSLRNIFKEINSDIGTSIPQSGNLERWARQGVLLLNTVLTVREHKPKSHQRKGWEKFTDAVIAKLIEQRKGIVFLLWGADAKKKGRKIDDKEYCVLSSGHPSPMSANMGHWFHNKHFSQTNEYLKSIGKEPIQW